VTARARGSPCGKTGIDHVFHVLQNRAHAEKGGLSPFSVSLFLDPFFCGAVCARVYAFVSRDWRADNHRWKER
jgi:hypothetical protein